jgi:hypothetical protein
MLIIFKVVQIAIDDLPAMNTIWEIILKLHAKHMFDAAWPSPDENYSPMARASKEYIG